MLDLSRINAPGVNLKGLKLPNSNPRTIYAVGIPER